MKKQKTRTIRACKPNPGIRAAYRKALETLIAEMRDDVEAKILEEYGSMESRIAQDWEWRSPAARMSEVLDGVFRKWVKRFENAAMTISTKFVKGIRFGVQRNRRQALKEQGVGGIKFNQSRFANETYEAALLENVNLIRTIPQRYLDDVAGKVQRAVSGGLQRRELAEELYQSYDITFKRAKVIARDQTNKATQALARATDKEIGITEGIWIHVPGRLTSRESHIRMNGKRFNIEEGLYDPEVGHNTVPGREILCQCEYRPVLPDNWGVTE